VSQAKKTDGVPGQSQPSEYEDRRRHKRAGFRLKARYLLDDGTERPCMVVNISAGGAMVRAKHTPSVGDRIVLYVDSVGRFEGVVIRVGHNGFAVQYRTRRAKSQRTADALIRVLNRGQRDVDRRLAPRIAMDRPVTVSHEDGSQVDATILDVSLTGASLRLDPRPPLGTDLIVGRMRARVVRHHDIGVGVIFQGPAERMDAVFEATGGPPEDPSDDDGDTRRPARFGTGLATPSRKHRSDGDDLE